MVEIITKMREAPIFKLKTDPITDIKFIAADTYLP